MPGTQEMWYKFQTRTSKRQALISSLVFPMPFHLDSVHSNFSPHWKKIEVRVLVWNDEFLRKQRWICWCGVLNWVICLVAPWSRSSFQMVRKEARWVDIYCYALSLLRSNQSEYMNYASLWRPGSIDLWLRIYPEYILDAGANPTGLGMMRFVYMYMVSNRPLKDREIRRTRGGMEGRIRGRSLSWRNWRTSELILMKTSHLIHIGHSPSIDWVRSVFVWSWGSSPW
jgi:hypothetical protein